MTDNPENAENADDMSEYLQTFLDETEEQLDDLVETVLALERDVTNAEDLNESFRLIHSIKGSAGMMGFDNITLLTHQLESRFERFRSGAETLDEATMSVVLRCIDFLRQCNERLRDGEELGSASELLDELRRLEEQPHEAERTDSLESRQGNAENQEATQQERQDDDDGDLNGVEGSGSGIRMLVRFRAGLQLADLKAQLIVARLAGIGQVRSTRPDLDELAGLEQVDSFEIDLETCESADALRAAADVDGVEAIELSGDVVESTEAASGTPHEGLQEDSDVLEDGSAGDGPDTLLEEVAEGETDESAEDDAPLAADDGEADAAVVEHAAGTVAVTQVSKGGANVGETMRVDIDRLDNLMNLAGELVVNRARFVQITEDIGPALRKANAESRVREFSSNLRRTIDSLQGSQGRDHFAMEIQQLREGLDLMEEQAEIWNSGRLCFGQISEAVDQLSRVSRSLQRGVLDTRMVPVAPLFNRFKRVVRDLSKARGKSVHLLIRGENTELDKRMIDELNEPLVHLVRNSIDHGLEAPETRQSAGKSAIGSIFLEASHRGNHVHIVARDDGGGIDVARIKSKLIEQNILPETAVERLSDQQALDYIWHPGFSTARQVTDVSGRGVGMDVVKTRIEELNGTVDVVSVRHQGTTFTIRLPLTLAIINGLLVRLRGVVFSMPMEDVREIVAVNESDVVSVRGNEAIDVRDEYIPLVSIDDVLQWHAVDYGHDRPEDRAERSSAGRVDVVILHAQGKTLGLRVDELLGSQDVVIKSLSENFTHIRGLSGASILGDGSVSLMLDVGAFMEMATGQPRTRETEDLTT